MATHFATLSAKMTMKLILVCFCFLYSAGCFAKSSDSTVYSASNKLIQYTGRVDHSNPAGPVLWAPGVYIDISFEGTYCVMKINDEERYGKSHNYIIVQVDDGMPSRIQTRARENSIVLASNLKEGKHRIRICKSTEAEIGYLQPVAFITKKLIPSPKKPKRKIEFIGDSITCGMGNDESSQPCGKGEWYDQNNAWMAYGPITARAVNAQWHLSSISGIGLIHSCCNKKTVMPPLFKKLSLSNDSIEWDFNRYQPDLVTVCLGQNDGIQDSVAFCKAYVGFMQQLRAYYPKARLVMLTSPMAGKELNSVLQKYILSIERSLQVKDKKIGHYFFKQQYIKGCSSHPSGADHLQMADELIPFLKKLMRWK